MDNAPLRLATLVVVAVAHAALLIWLAKVRPTSAPTAEPETSILLFMLPSSEVARSAPPGSASRQAVTRHARPSHPQANAGATSNQHAQSSAPVMIDWAQEARRAAVRQIDADEAAARRAAAFSTHKRTPDSLAPPATAQPQFGWSHANTHRIESLPGGGLILNLSDRCAIVFAVLLIPVCKLGTTEPRGDLLQHMDDPPQLGAPPTDVP
jgi:hypothetical protein